MIPDIFQDFAKRDFHLWLYKTHNAPALAKQFPKYTLCTFHRIRRGIQPKYMPDRVYLTFKGILDYADEHAVEAIKYSSLSLEIKYGLSEEKVRQYRKEWENGLWT